MVLEKINDPLDLKNLSISELETLAEEMRGHLLTVSIQASWTLRTKLWYGRTRYSSSHCFRHTTG